MIINGLALLMAAPIKNMVRDKIHEHGVSYGMSEAGYDIRIKQDIYFKPPGGPPEYEFHDVWTAAAKWREADGRQVGTVNKGKFLIASAIEEFDMPNDLVGIVHDKSSWARRGLSVFNTVIEPGWRGFLTLELVYHSDQMLHIPAGAGIAQVVFHRAAERRPYNGRYQNQESKPIPAIES